MHQSREAPVCLWKALLCPLKFQGISQNIHKTKLRSANQMLTTQENPGNAQNKAIQSAPTTGPQLTKPQPKKLHI